MMCAKWWMALIGVLLTGKNVYQSQITATWDPGLGGGHLATSGSASHWDRQMRCKRMNQSAAAVVCLMSPPANGRRIFTNISMWVRIQVNKTIIFLKTTIWSWINLGPKTAFISHAESGGGGTALRCYSDRQTSFLVSAVYSKAKFLFEIHWRVH